MASLASLIKQDDLDFFNCRWQREKKGKKKEEEEAMPFLKNLNLIK